MNSGALYTKSSVSERIQSNSELCSSIGNDAQDQSVFRKTGVW